jgi:voltage-gated potassium channel Kch
MRPRFSAAMPRRIERVLTSRHVFISLITTTIFLVVVCGIVISLVDREDFPSVWLGLWWAIGTVSTVGYGDVVPVQVGGRIIAAIVMIVGIGFLSLITATVASALVSRAVENQAGESADHTAALARIEQRLESLEREVRSLKS